jgi:hypothetical protein
MVAVIETTSFKLFTNEKFIFVEILTSPTESEIILFKEAYMKCLLYKDHILVFDLSKIRSLQNYSSIVKLFLVLSSFTKQHVKTTGVAVDNDLLRNMIMGIVKSVKKDGDVPILFAKNMTNLRKKIKK